MANTIRIKRRGSAGATGAPSSLENAELAFNEADNTLYYGKGTGGAGGTATSVEAIGGVGAFVTNSTAQTITGAKTFSGTTIVPTPSANTHAATKLYVDQAISNVTLSNTSVTAGAYGNGNYVGTFAVDSQGRLTAASNVAISISSAQITDFNEASQDAYGSLVSGGSQAGITVTYDDANTKVNYSVTNQSVNIYGDSGVTAFGVTANGGGSFSILGGTALTAAATTNTLTINLDNTAVTAGTYGNSKAAGTFTVDAQGRITSASNTAIALEYWEIANFASGVNNQIGNSITFGTQTEGVKANFISNTNSINFSLDSTYSPTFAGLTLNSSSIVFEGATADAFETTLTVTDPTADRTITIPDVTGTVITSGDTGSVATAMIANSAIATSKIADRAVTAVKLANTAVAEGNYGNASTVGAFYVDAQGRISSASNTAIAITASQITDRSTNLVTGLTGTSNEITVSNSGVGAVTLSLPSNVTIANNLTVSGDLTVQGNTVTLNTATLNVEDKNIVLANAGMSSSNTTADGGGITISAGLGGDKTFNWVSATAAWTSSEDLNLLTGKVFEINGNTVLSSTTLGSGVTGSSLTSLGTISTGVWNGSTIGVAYGGTGYNTYANGDLLYGYAGGLNKLTVGTSGQFLKIDGMGVPSWSDAVDGGTF